MTWRVIRLRYDKNSLMDETFETRDEALKQCDGPSDFALPDHEDIESTLFMVTYPTVWARIWGGMYESVIELEKDLPDELKEQNIPRYLLLGFVITKLQPDHKAMLINKYRDEKDTLIEAWHALLDQLEIDHNEMASQSIDLPTLCHKVLEAEKEYTSIEVDKLAKIVKKVQSHYKTDPDKEEKPPLH